MALEVSCQFMIVDAISEPALATVALCSRTGERH